MRNSDFVSQAEIEHAEEILTLYHSALLILHQKVRRGGEIEKGPRKIPPMPNGKCDLTISGAYDRKLRAIVDTGDWGAYIPLVTVTAWTYLCVLIGAVGVSSARRRISSYVTG